MKADDPRTLTPTESCVLALLLSETFPGVDELRARRRAARCDLRAFQRAALTAAATKIGVPGLHPHELRHTAASLAIASGADVKIVPQILGHKTATTTLDLYGHLYRDRLDEVADRLDKSARAAADVYPLCTGADVIKLPNVG